MRVDVSVRCGEELLTGTQQITPEAAFMSDGALRKLVGDGLARVTVELSHSQKDYGNGFEARVAVTLTCDQSEKGLEQGRMLALDLATAHLEEAREAGSALFEKATSS